jgi:TetR/AcrR family transcriptional regulator, copper-responsive repressor
MNKPVDPSRLPGRPREFDRDEALGLAMLLFWKRGYQATSVSELIDAMGITPPSLYSAFGDKKRLFLEAVDRYQAGPGAFAKQALTEEPTAERAIRRLLLGAVDSFCDPKHPTGCMVVLSATNCAVESDDVLQELVKRRRATERAIRHRIAAGQADGEFAANADVDALAGLVASALYGIAIKARDGAAPTSLRKIVDQTMRMWPRAGRKRA